jgi:uncharacterized membrane protein YheB (UPF0754 family)
MMDYVIIHHGIKGQKWGIRRFQNEDGSLTARGQKKRDREQKQNYKMVKKDFDDYTSKNRDELYNRIMKETNKLTKEEITKNKVQEITNKMLGKYGKKTINQIDRNGNKVTINKRLNELVNEVMAERAIYEYNIEW